jgi:hypothetical protein
MVGRWRTRRRERLGERKVNHWLLTMIWLCGGMQAWDALARVTEQLELPENEGMEAAVSEWLRRSWG